MQKQINHWGQTHDWEDACIKTRRNLKERRRRLNLLGIKKSDRVLDLGCGDGLNIGILTKKGVKSLTGIDISKELLVIAKKENKKAKFHLASAEKLPFKNSSFDVVLVDSVFHHFMKYSKALKEIKRVLTPGGKLCFIEPHKSIFRSFYDFISTSLLAKLIPPLARRGKSYLGEVKFMKHWLATEEVFYKNLKELGFMEELKKKDIMSIIGIYEKPLS